MKPKVDAVFCFFTQCGGNHELKAVENTVPETAAIGNEIGSERRKE